ncbi:3-thiaglutamate biosynthesis pearlin carrier peptide TglA [Moritella yayanosii]|uniref:Uncharacterized protein n=1 Tax=Moritella yayanosii TaxID=69539 RepID=A0A330LXP1_9GAMM|nr:TglA family RiPP precursor [Moritella yayanosii]SQD80711.1 conserved protein of unknown function, might be Response regulator [Moritella yayanosii]
MKNEEQVNNTSSTEAAVETTPAVDAFEEFELDDIEVIESKVFA